MNGKKSRAGKSAAPKSTSKRKINDPFFDDGPKKRKPKFRDEEIESDDGDEDYEDDADIPRNGMAQEPDELEEETADEKRKRLAKDLLLKYKQAGRKDRGEDDDDEDSDEEDDALVAERLQQDQLEDSGRLRRVLASRVLKPECGFELLVRHRQSVTAVSLAENDSRGFSASKDGNIVHWDVESGKAEKYKWPSDEALKSHGVKPPQGRSSKHSKQVLSLAVSSDGRYLASGGLDRYVHLWDARTREHIQLFISAFRGHKGAISCLTFREGTTELFSGSYDRTIKIWNADDRAYIESLFGHSSDVLDIDCLRKERILAVGRDRTMQLFKVPEGTRLKFLASASSLESCRFITNDEFLSGADDGSVQLWSVSKKKPVCIVKNAHAVLRGDVYKGQSNGGEVLANHKENGVCDSGIYDCVSAQSWVSALGISRYSDLAASGAGNGFVRLWAIESEAKRLQHLYDLPLVGFVNSMAFAKSGKFLLAGVGQEPRLGRWGLVPAAENGVFIQPLKLSER